MHPKHPLIASAQHGAFDYAELEGLGLNPDSILDFSVNSNPFGPSPLVWDALRSTPLERYPDRESIALRRALTQQVGVPVEQIMVGNGTAELIQLTACAFLPRGEQALVVEPTFGEYERCVRLVGAQCHHWRASHATGFHPDPAEIQQKSHAQNFHMVFLCNPNNPTGQILALNALDEWARSFPDTLFVVDEAYLAFAFEMASAISLRRDNILVLRSMTKDYAIAGLRLGYAIGCKSVIERLASFRPAWNVNALAQAVGLAVLQDETHLTDTLAMLRQEKVNLIAALAESGYDAVPSHTHYFLLPVENGARFRRQLLQSGILVRDCASFGLPAYIRIATRKYEENTRLLQAIREMRG